MSQEGRVVVLHVDDDAAFVEAAASMLERLDERLTVVTATGTEEATTVLDDRPIDCIVSDYEIDARTGLELLDDVRERRPDLPFVLFTGKGSEEVASDAISRGVTDYLQKETGKEQFRVLANRIDNAVSRYRSQRELAESRERLSLFFDQSPLGVVEWDRRVDIRRLNDQALEILGYDEAELLGESWQVLVPESEHDAVGRMAEDLQADAEQASRVTETIRGDGERILCEWHNRTITDSDGEIVGILSQFQDVTEREHRERQLEQHRESLEQLHDAADRLYVADSVEECYQITIDAAVTILGFDWCALTGPADNGEEFEIEAVSADAPVDVGDRPFGLDEGVAGHVYQTKEPHIVNDARESERGKPVEEDIRSAVTVPVGDWAVFQAVATSTESFDEQDRKHAELLVGSMVTAIDRLEQQTELHRRQAELERQNERLDQFASVVSHDLRNPLNVASGRLALAREDCESEHLDDIVQAHDRMEALIDDLLTLAREGERVEAPGTVDLPEVVRQCWAHVDTREASLHVDVAGSIEADRSQLEQLLENLVRNAVEHGGPAVTVTVGSLEDGFFVADDGPGIPEGDRDALFEPGHSTAEGGTGFGLSIVDQVVEAHGWEIAAGESAAGGARFEITGVERVGQATE
jgi:PAS domain S-box-containing protein